MAHVLAQSDLQPSERPSPIRIRKLGHVVLQVRNLERSKRFYTEVLNFRVSDNASVGGVFLTAVGDHHTIGLFPSDGDNAAIPGEGAVRLHHLAFQVGSLEELFDIRAYLRERGVPIVFEGRRALAVTRASSFSTRTAITSRSITTWTSSVRISAAAPGTPAARDRTRSR